MLPEAIHVVDIGLILSLLVTVGIATYGYGRLSQRVAYLEKEADDYMKQESFDLFRDEILRRLDRIDDAIGKIGKHG